MTAQKLLRLLEEMIDVKIRQHLENTARTTPEIARILQQKREADRARLDQLRSELIEILE